MIDLFGITIPEKGPKKKNRFVVMRDIGRRRGSVKSDAGFIIVWIVANRVKLRT